MLRLMLTDESWSRLIPILLDCGIYFKPGLRLVVEGILWKLRTGSPWRDLPDEFGPWSTVFANFNRWSKTGKWRQVFESLRTDPDNEWNFIDGSIVSAHQHAAGAAGGGDESIGKSRGGNTSKIHLLSDANGNPIELVVTAGQVHDVKMADYLIDRSDAEILIADKGYDSQAVRDHAEAMGITVVIPRRKGARLADNHDRFLYKLRHLIENLFAHLKRFRSIATRYDKLKRNYESMVLLGCILHWIKL